VCGIPQQSLARLQVTVSHLQTRSSIESRVPIQIEDIYNMACQKLYAGTEYRSTFIRYYTKKWLLKKFQKSTFLAC